MTRAVFEERLFGFLKWASVAFFVVVTAFPLVYMVSLSFKKISELLVDPGNFLPGLDDILALETYRQVLRSVEEGGQGFTRFIRNSVLLAFVTVVATTGVAVFSAYAAARLRFRGKRAISGGIILVYLFPAIVIAIPLFVVFTRLGMRNLYGLVVVYLAQTIPVSLYMLRSHFQTIPASVEEAGLVDGLSRFGVLRRITLPLSAPAIAAVALYIFMIAWNEFLLAFLFIVDQPDLWTLPLGLQQLNSTEVPTTVLMAGSVIISLPVIAVFFVAERFLTEGLTAGGVKG